MCLGFPAVSNSKKDPDLFSRYCTARQRHHATELLIAVCCITCPMHLARPQKVILPINVTKMTVKSTESKTSDTMVICITALRKVDMDIIVVSPISAGYYGHQTWNWVIGSPGQCDPVPCLMDTAVTNLSVVGSNTGSRSSIFKPI